MPSTEPVVEVTGELRELAARLGVGCLNELSMCLDMNDWSDYPPREVAAFRLRVDRMKDLTDVFASDADALPAKAVRHMAREIGKLPRIVFHSLTTPPRPDHITEADALYVRARLLDLARQAKP